MPCKFFLTDSGCTKGSSCSFSHNFSKKEKAGRCWVCGSTQHQQSSCPTKKGPSSPNAKGNGKAGVQKGSALAQLAASTTTTQSSISEPPALPTPLPPPGNQQASTSTTTPLATATATTMSQESEMKQLLEQANAMLKEMRQLRAVSLSTTQVENAAVGHGCNPHNGKTGLLDSGASHAFRAGTEEELSQAQRVTVQLATGSEVTLAQNRGGTLLSVPARGDEDISPIVPLGSLVQDLGCDLQWTRRRGLEIRHPQFGLIKPQVVGSCPLVGEACALDLIRELEEHKVRNLRESTRSTQKSLWMWDQEKPWARHLEEFLKGGRRADQLRAMSSEDSPFVELTEVEKSALAEQVDLTDKAGWNYLKAIPCSRQRRKRMMTMPWVLHLYAGDGKGPDPVFKVMESSRVVVEIDIARSLACDMFKVSGVYRCLLWAAATGRLDGVIGAPPARTEADSQLLLKQLWLFTVAKAARAINHESPVFMMIEGARVPRTIKSTEFSRWPTVGTGRRHQRVRHPDVYCLSLDVVGPFRSKSMDPNHNDYRYFLVGAYTMPGDPNPEVPHEEPHGDPKPEVPHEEPHGDPEPEVPHEEPHGDPKPEVPHEEPHGDPEPEVPHEEPHGDPELDALRVSWWS